MDISIVFKNALHYTLPTSVCVCVRARELAMCLHWKNEQLSIYNDPTQPYTIVNRTIIHSAMLYSFKPTLYIKLTLDHQTHCSDFLNFVARIK